jgi:hypothetical protein
MICVVVVKNSKSKYDVKKGRKTFPRDEISFRLLALILTMMPGVRTGILLYVDL